MSRQPRYMFGDPGLGELDDQESERDEELEQKLGPRFVDKPRRTAPIGTYIPAALARAKKRVVS